MRIAVVEDDDGVGEALVDALAGVGHSPVRMRRGADLLERHQHRRSIQDRVREFLYVIQSILH